MTANSIKRTNFQKGHCRIIVLENQNQGGDTKRLSVPTEFQKKHYQFNKGLVLPANNTIVSPDQAKQAEQLRMKLKALRTQILWIDRYSRSNQESINN